MEDYSGELTKLWKHQLEDIGEQLGIATTGSRLEIEDAVRSRLQNDNKARAMFPGLVDPALPKTVKRSVDSPSSNGSNGRSSGPAPWPTPAGPAKRTPRKPSGPNTSTPRSPRAAATILNTLQEASRDVAQDLPELVSEGAQQLATAGKQLVNTADQQLAVVKSIDNRQVMRSVAVWVQRAEEQAGEKARLAQMTLSDGWTVIAGTILFELGFILMASIPLAKQLTVGPFVWWSRPWTPDTPWTITLPDLMVLWKYGTLGPILAWVLAGLLLPAIFAHLIIFPKPQYNGRRTRSQRYYLGLHPPSALTFSITRLALVVYHNKMATEPFIRLSSDIFNRFGNIQLLAASLGLAFTTYELLAGHLQRP